MVSFDINDHGDSITLMSCSFHLIMTFFPTDATKSRSDAEFEIKRSCIKARKILETAISDAAAHLRYDKNKVKPIFVCIYECCKDKYSPFKKTPKGNDGYCKDELSLFEETTKGYDGHFKCCKGANPEEEKNIWFGSK